jgi:hypothetical protein
MQAKSETYEALFAEWTGREWRIATKVFHADDDRDALETAEDLDSGCDKGSEPNNR